jgi:hypothetical protein
MRGRPSLLKFAFNTLIAYFQQFCRLFPAVLV